MLLRVSNLLFSLASISTLSQANPVGARDAVKCDIPSWTIQNLNVTYSDVTDTPGSTTFTLVDSLTKKSDVLTCPLPFNSIGRIEGTPSNKDLRIRMTFYVGSAFVEISQNLTCAGTAENSTSPSLIKGGAELPLICPDPPFETMTCTAPSTQITGMIQEE